MRVRAEYQKPVMKGRLLLLSPFAKMQRRITKETAVERNRFVAALADAIFVAHAEPNGKTEQFCHDVLAWRKPLYTLESEANANLLALGAKPVSRDNAFELTENFEPSLR
jgi:predicted Rossmann fold nucleotide-binding protein DprA/Smf involved in DNA uptake